MLGRLGRFAGMLVLMLTLALATMAIATAAGGTQTKSTTTIAIGGKATLTTSPGAVLSITYTCFPSGAGNKGGYGGYNSAFGDVRLTDLQGNQGFAFFSPTCDDKKHTANVEVPGVFNPGAGAANAFICGFDCNGVSREVKIG